MNQFILDGRVGFDPVLTKTESGKLYTNFCIYNNCNFGKVDHTNLVNLVAWGKTAQLCADYLSKGVRILVVGYLNTRSYKAKSGKESTITEHIVQRFEFIESKKNTQERLNSKLNKEFNEINDENVNDSLAISSNEVAAYAATDFAKAEGNETV